MSEKNIIKGPRANIVKESFGQVLYKSLKNGGNEIAMVDAVTGQSLTYKNILQKSVSLAQYLKKFGLKKNDCISISSENNLYFTIPALSALYLGIIIAPLNHSYTTREYIHAMNISKPKMIFCSSLALENIENAVKQIGSIEKIIVIDNGIGNNSIEQFLNLPLSDHFDITEVGVDDVAAMLCSSGTTGLPKCVMLTHNNFNSAHFYLKHPDYVIFEKNKIGMALLPFYHAYGFMSNLGMLAEHMKVIILPRFEEKLFLNSIQQFQITLCCLVPPLILFLAKSPLVDQYNLSSLKDLICGAAPLGKEVQDLAMKRLGLNCIRQGYGLTEITLAATMSPINLNKVGTVGILAPGLEAKVIDISSSEALGPNCSGELCFKGSLVMKGYYNDPEATAQTIDADHWLHTGDIGYYDEQGYFFIVDRLKELIKYKSYQVPPAEIEDILLQHPEIKDCAVIGKPDAEAGELPVAFVVKQSNASINAKDVIDFVAENVSYHKRLHGGVKFVASIPKNPTGKILRRILRQQFFNHTNLKSKL